MSGFRLTSQQDHRSVFSDPIRIVVCKSQDPHYLIQGNKINSDEQRNVFAAIPSARIWNGFTIIELLAVIAVVAILFSITTVVVSEVRNKAQETRCLNNLRQIGAAALTYTHDNGGRLIETDTPGGTWIFRLAPYLGDEERVLKNIKDGVYRCPIAEMRYGVRELPTTYAINATTEFQKGARLVDAREPSRTLFLADGRGKPGGGFAVKFNSQNHGYYHGQKNSEDQNSGQAAGLFLDGHVSLFSRSDYESGAVSNALDPDFNSDD